MAEPLEPLFCYASRHEQEENPNSQHPEIQAALMIQV